MVRDKAGKHLTLQVTVADRGPVNGFEPNNLRHIRTGYNFAVHAGLRKTVKPQDK
jgi:hypothetical protein